MNRGRLAIPMAVFALIAPSTWAPNPAHASVDSCTGTGTMSTNPYYYPPSPPTSTAFSITLNVVCVTFATQVTMNGFINGWCGLMSGYGTANVFGTHAPPSGHRFAINGSSWFLTGEVVGFLAPLADPASGQSCFSGATSFIVVAAPMTFNHNGCVVRETAGPGYTTYTCDVERGLSRSSVA